ncbi:MULTISPECIES: site-specific integrase [Burkholderia]|uniref:Phage integrase family protein n=1 Tax=Burkholderia pyrrocinia TaxID=60550 RepID=A0A318IXI2_BURPY|nr:MULTISPECIES: site-specific integrase [Burkholderia]PXX39071.1 phage integrase family protein [Burkholderia pyrrocinia]SFW15797.1 Phage integrase family protein [Burkholderia sp. NFACC33-1]SFX07477.1 Phage integrase family protein [Burkholderia sp. NFPP32]
MATKRLRPSGTWEYIIRRSKLLPKPLSLTFQSEEEGDAYVARLEQLLDAGIVPADVVEQREMISTTLDAIREYLRRVSVPDSDNQVLNTLLGRLPSKALTTVDYEWAERWVTGMKREQHLSPSTIRHNVGALARCFDWVVKSGTPMLAVNPLRLLPKRYATYTDEDRVAVEAQDVAVKEDVHRDRRPSAGEEAEIRRIMAGEKPKGRERAFELPYRPALVLLFELAIESAMRMREMYTLELVQFDVERRTAALERTKNGSKRAVPLTTVAIGAFERYVAAVNGLDPEMGGFAFDGGRLFPWIDEIEVSMRAKNMPLLKRKVLERVTVRLSGQFGRIFDAAGCSDLVFHDLRYEATSRLYERTTLSDIQIAKITGHTDPKVLMRYANLRGSDLAARLW